ncbi:hypothetical protein ACHAPA_002343 [Fusarium lateritium]
MDSNNGKDFNNSRRSSTRRSRSLRLSTGSGVTDDDYDLSAMMVADGFRPTDNATSSSTNPATNTNTHTESSVSSTESFSQQTESSKSSQAPLASRASSEITPAIRNRPSSISKPHRNHDSLALRNDGTSTTDRSHVRNNHSLSSNSPVIRAESPYTGPSGPSHPYQMYPQRTMSVTTTSTAANAVVPEDRPYAAHQGPAHPYALYTQNTTSGESSNPSIPVGFNGLGGSYQRQLGPDGEEAGDLVGPLGHMEELPPYTRYPDNAYVPKPTPQAPTSPASPISPISPTSPVSSVSEPVSPARDIPGAGGIGIATRDPEFSSTDDDLALPRTRPSVRSNGSESSHHDINTAAIEVSEKPAVNKWQRRAKKKLCGIVPYWAICLLLVGLVLMGIIMGAVIGTMLSKSHEPPPDIDDKYATAPPTTTVYDPEIIAVPTDLPSMATGRFTLPNIDPASQGTSTCFNDSTQQAAWSCEIINPIWSIHIEENCDPKNKSAVAYNMTLKAIKDYNTPFPYGAQPPTIVKAAHMVMVNDTLEIARGPAWWLRTTYNKTVIVSEKKFGEMDKRGWDYDDNENNDYEEYNSFHRFKNKPLDAKLGEKPWFCTWPNTVIEFFIYPSENATASTYHQPSISSTVEKPTSTESDSPSSTSSWDDLKLPPYPHVYKMMERRFLWGEDSVAYCTQYEVIGDGSQKRPVTKDGKKVVMIIVEDDDDDIDDLDLEFPTASGVVTHSLPPRLLKRTTPSLTDCGCSWRSQ